jgi:fimbrial chaperone protein
MWPFDHRLFERGLLALAAGAAAVPASAGVVVSPVVLEVSSPRRPVTVTVTNSGDRAVTFQTGALLWQQADGVDRYEPTSELVVVPPIVEVPPHASQVFRVMLRSPAPSPVERTYRLLLEDITQELAATGGQAAISFRLNHSLPVMVAPAGKVQDAIRWKPCTADGAARAATVCIRVLNAGNRRVKFEALTVAGDGWQQVLSLQAGENVLAGAQREWHVPLAKGQGGAPRDLQVRTARGETLQAESGGF